jgi:hypothetical protein
MAGTLLLPVKIAVVAIAKRASHVAIILVAPVRVVAVPVSITSVVVSVTGAVASAVWPVLLVAVSAETAALIEVV